jgi:hypothetical protein
MESGKYQEIQNNAYKNLDKMLESIPKKEVDRFLIEALKRFFQDFNKVI